MKPGENIHIFLFISFLCVATPGGPLSLKIVLPALAEASPTLILRSISICFCRRRKPVEVVESLNYVDVGGKASWEYLLAAAPATSFARTLRFVWCNLMVHMYACISSP